MTYEQVAECQLGASEFKQKALEDRYNNYKDCIQYINSYKIENVYKQNGWKEVEKIRLSEINDKSEKKKNETFHGVLTYAARWGRRIKSVFIYKKQKYNKIVMMGGFAGQNVGDEAQIDETYSIMKKRYPEYLVKILSPVMNHTYNNHGECLVGENSRRLLFDMDEHKYEYYYIEEHLLWKIALLFKGWISSVNAYLVRAGLPTFFINAKKSTFLNEIKTSDLVYLSGGGYLTGDTLSRLWDHLFVIKIADIMHVPVVMSGHNIGLWNSKFTKKFAAKYLKRVKVITLRDSQASLNDLKAIGITGDNIFVTHDDALFCKKKDDVKQILRKIGLNDDEKYILLNLHYWGMNNDEEGQKKLRRQLQSLIEHVIKETRCKVVLLPMTGSDATCCYELYKYNYIQGMHILKFYTFDFRVIRGIISGAECCITMKHHPIIFSMGEKVPVLSVTNKEYGFMKNQGALSLFGLELYCVDLQSTSDKDVNKMFDDVWNNREMIKRQIEEKLGELKKRRENFLVLVDEILKEDKQ